MKIAVINETSAGDKNPAILAALEDGGHEIINAGMKEKGAQPELSYIHTGLLAAILLNLKRVDFVVGGCGTGQGFLNSRWVLFIPHIAANQVFGIFLCRTFFETLPESLFEAARLDGASEFQVYRRIGLPLSLPIIAALAIMTFVAAYNDYIWPLVTVSDSI